ncbi:YdgH/BhsA/McbA-like domain containing protein [Erwinia psidii]|uniref:DUF1471 domain-containing protein n=1 Tax=Erwinia psidii TaxID=69224 RepID=A0A3N6TY85_9GAMM|nr:YdgH/BhsA/McbA-like domain containing protein [Erwinia psidii]MCX8956732.1 DUF1471 domain-containing protein [Erwinia psidii]MCX8964360.1 DUF1471 domain-containing protein [Erwinia psidii]RQM40242.1 DUF1471 domain-containing protein [Erwinia psidii]
MNVKLPVFFAVVMAAATSFSALSATSVDQSQSQNLQEMGTVSISGVRGSLDDATHRLREKAQDAGASYYRIIGVDNPGDSSLWTGTAKMYR